jgi:hypothetical protein
MISTNAIIDKIVWNPLNEKDLSYLFNRSLKAVEVHHGQAPIFTVYVPLNGFKWPLKAEYGVSTADNSGWVILHDFEGKFMCLYCVDSPEKKDVHTQKEILLQSELDYYKGFHDYICEQSQRGVR